MKQFWVGYTLGSLIMMGWSVYWIRGLEERQTQAIADSFFAGQEEATNACKGEMDYAN